MVVVGFLLKQNCWKMLVNWKNMEKPLISKKTLNMNFVCTPPNSQICRVKRMINIPLDFGIPTSFRQTYTFLIFPDLIHSISGNLEVPGGFVCNRFPGGPQDVPSPVGPRA